MRRGTAGCELLFECVMERDSEVSPIVWSVVWKMLDKREGLDRVPQKCITYEKLKWKNVSFCYTWQIFSL